MRSLLAGALACVVLAGCGSDPRMSDEAEQQLDARVDALRAAALARDAAGIDAALAALRADFDALRANGEISDRAAEDVTEAIAGFEAVRTQLPLVTTTTQPPLPTSPPSEVDEPRDEDNDDEDTDDDKGNDDTGKNDKGNEGRGRGGDDDD